MGTLLSRAHSLSLRGHVKKAAVVARSWVSPNERRRTLLPLEEAYGAMDGV